MFYDLESPLDFMRGIRDILAKDGIWIFEQSYLSSMIANNAYDTICHEHLEYYGVSQIQWMVKKAGLKILDIELNVVNGGGFCVIAALANSSLSSNVVRIRKLLSYEKRTKLDSLKTYQFFQKRAYSHRDQLRHIIARLRKAGKTVFGYGASTKGNVLLQFCGFSQKDIPYIAEINKDKFGCFTPGTKIPIISEQEAKALSPDCFLVLPWHFKDVFVTRERKFLKSGGSLLLPLPEIAILNGATKKEKALTVELPYSLNYS